MGVADAFAFGADAIVVGRPISRAADPRAAAEAIQAEGKDSTGKSPVELAWGVALDSEGGIIGQGGVAP